jgi:hypothetical protein
MGRTASEFADYTEGRFRWSNWHGYCWQIINDSQILVVTENGYGKRTGWRRWWGCL